MVFGATNIGFKHNRLDVYSLKNPENWCKIPKLWSCKFFFGGKHVGAKASEPRYHPKSQASQQNHAAISHQIIDLPPSPSSLSFAAGHCERGRHLRLWWPGPSGPECPRFQVKRNADASYVIESYAHLLRTPALSVFVCVSKQEIYK